MDTWLIVYRLSGWSQDIIWLAVCWLVLRKYWFWKGHYQYFLYYALSATILHLIAAISAMFLDNNLFLDYLYITIEFICIGFFLKGTIGVEWISRFISLASLFFFAFQFLNAFLIEGLSGFNSNGAIVNNLYIIALSIWSYTALAKRGLSKNIFAQPDSWLVLGLLFNNLVALLFGFLYELSLPYGNDDILYAVLVTQNCLISIFIVFFARGVAQIRER